MKRMKPSPEIVATLQQAEGALAEIASLDRKLATIEANMNTSIDEAKAMAQQASAGLSYRRKALADAVATFATLNKTELFKEKRSLELAFGVIGWRQSTQLTQQTRITQAMTLEKLHSFGFLDAIRTKEEINKEVMVTWLDERLDMVGMKRRQLDSFYIEIKAEDLGAA